MSERAYERCKKCGDWGWFPSHRCAPIWEARLYETRWQEDWHEVNADSAETAARKFAEQYDQGGDYDIIKRGSAEIEVRKQGDNAVTLMDVSAESVPQYYAHPRRAQPSPNPAKE